MRRFLISCLVVLLVFLTARLFAGGVATIRSGDVFDMRVSGMPLEEAQQFAQQYTVGPDGTINVPLIGEIKAIGLTTPQLARSLEDRFVAKKIFTQPTVIVSPVQGSRVVSVTGEVKNPGRISWSGDLTLSSAVGECGNWNDFADPKKVRIIREGRIFGIFNLIQIEKDPAKDPKLLPGDHVIVP